MALPLAPVTNLNGSAIGVINNNSDKLTDEFAKTFYKDGSVNMDGPIDMDSNRIINLPRATTPSSPVTLEQFLAEKKGDQGIQGLPGVGGNTFLSLASLKALNPLSYASAILADGTRPPLSYAYVSGNFTGKADDVNVIALNGVPLTTGAMVLTAAQGVGYRRRGTTATTALATQDILEQSHYLIEWLPYGWKADGTVDYSTQLQAAMDYRAAQGGGKLLLPQGTITAGAIFTNQVVLEGLGKRETVLLPPTGRHQFQLPATGSLVRFGLRNLMLKGDQGSANTDLVHMAPVGGFTDSTFFENVTMTGAKRRAIHLEGTGSEGGFVQLVTIDNCEITNNGVQNLFIKGYVLETDIQRSSICGVLDTSGNGASVQLEGAADGVGPARIGVYSSIFNNPLPNRLTTPADAPAWRIYKGGGISFTGCSFEECGVGIDIISARSVHMYMGDFANGSSAGMSAAIRVADCPSLVAAFGGVFGNVKTLVQITGTPSQVPNPTIIPGGYTLANITSVVDDQSAGRVEIITGNIPACRSQIALVGEGNLTDDLTGIVRLGGTVGNGFPDGTEITLTRWAGTGTISVRHGSGNLRLNGGQDFVFSNVNLSATITFRWSADMSLWLEKARTNATGDVTVAPSLVSSLPAANAANRGWRGTVTDATSPSFLATAVGGGSVVAPVLSNGTSWVFA